ncbi:MAG TPA: hypothetical protein VH207_12400 [Chthoniobacterales bacterium]|nr:hypothetical protein [Chthoniobacterales bacterium]
MPDEAIFMRKKPFHHQPIACPRNAFWTRLAYLIAGAATACALLTAAAPGALAQGATRSGLDEAASGTWQQLVNQPPFQTDTALLLTDGTIMVHQYSSQNWWRLTADNTGSYLNGTWSQLASMASNYGPLYFASAVLADGRVIVEGGEYNFGSPTETTQGAIYDPVANSWTTVNPPAGWTAIGDSPGIVLADNTFMLGEGGGFFKKQAIFNATTLTWTAVGTGKADTFVEAGLSLLPNGHVLTVDCNNGTNSETYDPATGAWTTAGSTIVKLPDAGSLEIGPLIQLPDGRVAAFGGTPHTALYDSATGTWAVGPDFPGGNDMADGPASLLPDGTVLTFASPGVFQKPASFFIFDGTTFTTAPSTQTASNHTSYEGRQLILPTGQILWLVADGRTIDVELYTSTGRPNAAWAPNITSVSQKLRRGNSYVISGTQFNGLSCGSDYGDDATMASNYPLVRITNQATGHVFYARTHDHSTMAIATGNAIVSTTFDVPATAETGQSRIEVVANGIASKGRRVTIR